MEALLGRKHEGKISELLSSYGAACVYTDTHTQEYSADNNVKIQNFWQFLCCYFQWWYTLNRDCISVLATLHQRHVFIDV
jgi:hypothetical protein